MRQTIFTPTYNRANTLPRLYESIKSQQFKDFCWLIIDDGSRDETYALVKSWLKRDETKTIENGFCGLCYDADWLFLTYIKKENGGKHTAQKMAYNIVETPYITEVDSDDAILPTTIQDFEESWIDIENFQTDIAKVSMFTRSHSGNIRGFGNYIIPKDVPYIEAHWHEYVLRQHNHREYISSISVEKFKECIDYSFFTISNGKPMKFISESILWSLIGKKYRTRILNKTGLTVYLDAENSILRGEQNYFNNMANDIYFQDINIEYFWWNPRYFIAGEKRMADCAVKSNIKLIQMMKYIKNKKHKYLMAIFYIPFYIIAKIKG
jgi:glycosyltransferase involved in cell wall biosynthesis